MRNLNIHNYLSVSMHIIYTIELTKMLFSNKSYSHIFDFRNGLSDVYSLSLLPQLYISILSLTEIA